MLVQASKAAVTKSRKVTRFGPRNRKPRPDMEEKKELKSNEHENGENEDNDEEMSVMG